MSPQSGTMILERDLVCIRQILPIEPPPSDVRHNPLYHPKKGVGEMTKVEQEESRRLWEARVADFRASGLSGPQWCAAHGFKLRQLRYWQHKLKTPDASASGT